MQVAEVGLEWTQAVAGRGDGGCCVPAKGLC